MPLASPHTRRISSNPDSLGQVFQESTEAVIQSSFCSPLPGFVYTNEAEGVLALAHASESSGHDYCETRTGSSKMSFLA